MNRIYTKEEKDKILSTMQYMVEDMFKIYDQTDIKKLAIATEDYLSIGPASTLLITKSCIKLIQYREEFDDDYYLGIISCGGCYKKDKTYILGTRTLNKPKANKIDLDVLTDFIENYEAIRDSLYDESKNYAREKGSSLDDVDAWYNRFRQETEIHFELPPTNNQYRVEVTSENGQTIGTFFFGDKIINIITNGEMNFIDKRTNEKVKRK